LTHKQEPVLAFGATISARRNLRAVTLSSKGSAVLGHAQADFGEATDLIGVVEQKTSLFALDLTCSDACFVRAYPVTVGTPAPWDM